MSFQRGIDGSDPGRPDPVGRSSGALHEERRAARTSRLCAGTLACPLCDAPVALTDGAVAPGSPLRCPFCGHPGPVRDFLSLTAPSRPARVEVRVVRPLGGRAA